MRDVINEAKRAQPKEASREHRYDKARRRAVNDFTAQSCVLWHHRASTFKLCRVNIPPLNHVSIRAGECYRVYVCDWIFGWLWDCTRGLIKVYLCEGNVDTTKKVKKRQNEVTTRLCVVWHHCSEFLTSFVESTFSPPFCIVHWNTSQTQSHSQM